VLRLDMLLRWPDVLRLDVLLQWPGMLWQDVLSLRLYLLQQRAGLRPRPAVLRPDVLLQWPGMLQWAVLSPRLYVLRQGGLPQRPPVLPGHVVALLRVDANLLRPVLLQRRHGVLQWQVLP
jgi:hypothetical protein